MIPAGKYIARATGLHEFGQSDKGTDFTWIDFKISRGELAGDQIGKWFYWTNKTTKLNIEALRYCGCEFPGNDITNLEGLSKNEVEIVIEHETYDGETRAKVSWVNNLSRGVKDEQRMTPSVKASFRDRMKGAIVAAKQDTGTSRSRPAEPLPLSDGDVPF